MKKIATLFVALLVLLSGTAFAETIGFYADNVDSYYEAVSSTMIALAAQDPDVEWEVEVVTGKGSASEQLDAVQNFIEKQVDAIIVIQNNAQTTSECITMAKDAGIPYFGASHDFSSAPNAFDAAGSCCYDFVKAGWYAGDDAAARGVVNVVNIEGVLGQGSAAAQSLGFIQAYIDAGKDVGPLTAEQMAADKPTTGGADLNIVTWQSGGWMRDSARSIMENVINQLGDAGFDGVYAQNDPMLEGVIDALNDAGLDPADYWLGASNGREIAWQLAEEGVITMDVNQAATLEGDVLYQQLKAYFAGQEYRKYIHPYLTSFNKDNIAEVKSSLLPFTDTAEYLAQRNAGMFVYDINDALFVDNPGYLK